MSRLSRYEKVILGLGLAFLLAAGGYRLGGESRARPYQVSVTRADQPVTAAAAESDSSRPDSLMEGERIDLNTATLSDLTRLPGIGEKKGQAILDKRTELGGFQSVDQLLEVRGIGEGILARINPYVTVTP